ncbi:hypothetical protein [Pseudomonas frederiksbergensis]|uniref:hypothetical protein n=1 Tax=Pseudomonas frederiksbergensis TaxID=104087 RepID=UPI003D1F5B4C
MIELSKLFPITVVVAIFLFLIKEVFEFFKKKSEKSRKISAYKILIAEEMSKNAWTIFILREVIKRLRDSTLSVEVLKAPDGSTHVKTSKGDDYTTGIVLPFHSSIFDKHIVDLAVLDKVFFLRMKDTYQKIAEAKVSITTTLEICKDFRCNLVSNVVLDNLVAVINAAEVQVKETFTLCTGKQLDSHKPISFI